MATLFVSDLHLDAQAPAAIRTFIAFLAGPARTADALYVLGDLFETWIGDDDTDPARAEVCAALAALARHGVPVLVMRGNRDFLLGPGFEARACCTLLPDPVIADLYGERVLLSHGDLLCTDDAAYQELRAIVSAPGFRRRVYGLSLADRERLAAAARAGSRAHLAHVPDEVMDVNAAAVVALLRAARLTQIVHGHTHRPAVHEFTLDGAGARRIVLDAWYEHGGVLEWGPDGPQLRTLAFEG